MGFSWIQAAAGACLAAAEATRARTHTRIDIHTVQYKYKLALLKCKEQKTVNR